jgi:hypothetical protein
MSFNKIKSALSVNRKIIIFGFFIIVLWILISFVDYTIIRFKPHADLPPMFTGYFWFRTVLIACTSVALVFFIGIFYIKAYQGINTLNLISPLYHYYSHFIAIGFFIIFVTDDVTFKRLNIEDGIVEWASSILFFFAMFVCLITIWNLKKSKTKISKQYFILLIILSVGFFVLGMEEISWMQRVFNIETPEFFNEHSWQKELNLHNLQNNIANLGFYCGSWCFLIFLPFVATNSFFDVRKIKLLRIIIPDQKVMLFSMPIATFVIGYWNFIGSQIVFFGSVSILLIYFLYTSRKATIAFMMVELITMQLIFLFGGYVGVENAKYFSEYNETRELLIALAYFYYSIHVAHTIKLELTRP